MATTIVLIMCVTVVVMQLVPIAAMVMLGNRLLDAGPTQLRSFIEAGILLIGVAIFAAFSAPYSALAEPVASLLRIYCGVFTLLSVASLIIYTVMVVEQPEPVNYDQREFQE